VGTIGARMPGMTSEDQDDILPEWTAPIVGAAIEVHRALGPGLLESAYQTCLAHELRLRDVCFEQQVPLPIHYKGIDLDCGYRLDFLVQNRVIVEIKAVERISPIHLAQALTYLRMKELPIALLLNFNVELMKFGIRRVIDRAALDRLR
jgi:GxxExxY protein